MSAPAASAWRNAWARSFNIETQFNAFVTIPFSKMTESVLKKEKVPHTVYGPRDRGARQRVGPIRRPAERRDAAHHGQAACSIRPSRESLNMLRKILESLVDPVKDRRKLCFTVPAAPLGAEDNLTYHEATLRQILSELGYEVKSINEGLAVIYSELESSNYTGIGISCGGGLCNVCVAYLSVPCLASPSPKPAITSTPAPPSITGERANRVRIVKEDSFHFNGFFADKLQQVLGVYYDEMIQSLVRRHEAGVLEFAQSAASQSAAADRAERRDRAAGRFPGPFREDPGGSRTARLRWPRSAWRPIRCIRPRRAP